MNAGILGSKDLHLNSVISVTSSSLFYNNPGPLFAGCSSNIGSLSPVYLWMSTSFVFNNDYILSKSNVNPFNVPSKYL
jgi:hypothetical protein